ncbi:NIPSNAP family protein [Cronobacter turicensis]|uniref:NIPSNAP family protein n=1 Tax=Cronobacter turicensis TaxID=413502 RepID=UPI0024C3FD97|nr:NIPSNAP family protein [Cronobacter turicensis]MDK1226260.1 NIPSNAP family protein [Cronobacter turicensis]
MKTVEILQYTLRKGTGRAFHTLMQDSSVPLHQRHGIDVVRFGHSLHDPDCYCLIRAFSDQENMAAALETFYASDAWRHGPREAIVNSIETSHRTLMTLPAASIEGLRNV